MTESVDYYYLNDSTANGATVFLFACLFTGCRNCYCPFGAWGVSVWLGCFAKSYEATALVLTILNSCCANGAGSLLNCYPFSACLVTDCGDNFTLSECVTYCTNLLLEAIGCAGWLKGYCPFSLGSVSCCGVLLNDCLCFVATSAFIGYCCILDTGCGGC